MANRVNTGALSRFYHGSFKSFHSQFWTWDEMLWHLRELKAPLGKDRGQQELDDGLKAATKDGREKVAATIAARKQEAAAKDAERTANEAIAKAEARIAQIEKDLRSVSESAASSGTSSKKLQGELEELQRNLPSLKQAADNAKKAVDATDGILKKAKDNETEAWRFVKQRGEMSDAERTRLASRQWHDKGYALWFKKLFIEAPQTLIDGVTTLGKGLINKRGEKDVKEVVNTSGEIEKIPLSRAEMLGRGVRDILRAGTTYVNGLERLTLGAAVGGHFLQKLFKIGVSGAVIAAAVTMPLPIFLGGMVLAPIALQAGVKMAGQGMAGRIVQGLGLAGIFTAAGVTGWNAYNNDVSLPSLGPGFEKLELGGGAADKTQSIIDAARKAYEGAKDSTGNVVSKGDKDPKTRAALESAESAATNGTAFYDTLRRSLASNSTPEDLKTHRENLMKLLDKRDADLKAVIDAANIKKTKDEPKEQLPAIDPAKESSLLKGLAKDRAVPADLQAAYLDGSISTNALRQAVRRATETTTERFNENINLLVRSSPQDRAAVRKLITPLLGTERDRQLLDLNGGSDIKPDKSAGDDLKRRALQGGGDFAKSLQAAYLNQRIGNEDLRQAIDIYVSSLNRSNPSVKTEANDPAAPATTGPTRPGADPKAAPTTGAGQQPKQPTPPLAGQQKGGRPQPKAANGPN